MPLVSQPCSSTGVGGVFITRALTPSSWFSMLVPLETQDEQKRKAALDSDTGLATCGSHCGGGRGRAKEDKRPPRAPALPRRPTPLLPHRSEGEQQLPPRPRALGCGEAERGLPHSPILAAPGSGELSQLLPARPSPPPGQALARCTLGPGSQPRCRSSCSGLHQPWLGSPNPVPIPHPCPRPCPCPWSCFHRPVSQSRGCCRPCLRMVAHQGFPSHRAEASMMREDRVRGLVGAWGGAWPQR